MNDANVISLVPTPVDKSLIAGVRELLRSAKAGDLRGLVIGQIKTDGNLSALQIGSVGFADHALLIQLMTMELTEAIVRERTPSPGLPSELESEEEEDES